MAANNPTSTASYPLDEAVIRDSIDFLLHDTGDKIIKSEENLTHLANLETAADNGGLSAAHFSRLVRIAVSKQIPSQLSRRFLSTLVPSQPVKGGIFSLYSVKMYSFFL